MSAPSAQPYQYIAASRPSPHLIICDHASRAVPPQWNALGLAPDIFALHVAWDIGAAAVARGLAARLDADAVLAGFSRLLIDPNRGLDHPDLIRKASDGIVVPGNQNVSGADRERRISEWYQPYHDRIAAELAARAPDPVLISIHSFTPEMDGFSRPWHAALLHGDDARFVAPVIAEFAAHYPDLVVGDNEPYTGYSHHSHTVLHHGEYQGRANVTFEIRQDLIDSPAGAALWSDILARVLAAPLRDPALCATVDSFREPR